ncbi:MAG: arsenite methyltransferase [Bacteroidetes bacterium]|nr:arsenite methyltransferase [Bacteroidota bacterium]
MENVQEIKSVVKQKYSEIAEQSKEMNQSSCCGSGGCSEEVYNIMTEDYSSVAGYNPDADLGLGCGLPTKFAKIKKGDTVVDLGSGAGNDCFIARHETGESGKVIGVDFSETMISKARLNAERLKFNNIEFRQGDIENIPVSNDQADVVVSNCVLNLVPNKERVLSEVYRVLKPGAHFSISDVVLIGDLPEAMVKNAELYVGCVSGAIQKDAYLSMVSKVGFKNMIVQKEKPIVVPDDLLLKYISQETIEEYKKSGNGIFSITVYAEKPADKAACCGPDCCS